MYTIRFDFPEVDQPCFAGDYKGSPGFAPTLKTALFWDTAEIAERFLSNAYGSASEYGRVVGPYPWASE